MKKIILITLGLFISISSYSDEVSYFVSESTKKNNYPFSDAVTVGDIVYLSGVVGEDESGSIVSGGIVPEAHQALKNIQITLNKLNLSLDNVFKCLVMIDDIEKWSQFNSVYIQYFNKPYPARSAFGADGLALNASFEIECSAKIPNDH
jgi:reactive intermediate/imine deaminase